MLELILLLFISSPSLNKPCRDIEKAYLESLVLLKKCAEAEGNECSKLFRVVEVLEDKLTDCKYGGL
jgi:hypothetical protein